MVLTSLSSHLKPKMKRRTKIASPPLSLSPSHFSSILATRAAHISTDFLNKRGSTLVVVAALGRDERVNLCGSLFQAYVQLIEHFGWKSYTILYEDNQGLAQYQKRKITIMRALYF